MNTTAETVLFDATLRPNPPMSAFALRLVVCVLAVFNIGFGLLFILRGAWPVTPFMGADVLFLAWALHVTRIAARTSEQVRLTPAALLVSRRPARGQAIDISLNPYWVRVEMDDPPESRSKLLLWSHGKSVQIGSFLAPGDRLSLARALKAALGRARTFLQ